MTKQKIVPCLWFDYQAEEAAKFYTSVMKQSELGQITRYTEAGKEVHGQESGSVLTTQFFLFGQEFLTLNGGSHFTFNPSITFFVTCESYEETDWLWEQLIEGGEAMMPLGKYPWSDRYGWLNDQYGVSWQIYTGNLADVGQKITPLLFFSGKQQGNAATAHDFYMKVFHGSSDGVAKYGTGEEGLEGLVKHAQFRLKGHTFMAMDSAVDNNFPFNEAISLIINCTSQEEVDYYWEQLLADGGIEQQCGWLKDQFGVSWQVMPEVLPRLLHSKDAVKSENVMRSMMQMKKLDIPMLERAFREV